MVIKNQPPLVKPGQVWSTSASLGGGRVAFRIVEVHDDVVTSEGVFRGKVCRRVLSARALARGVRAARLEVDEHGTPVVVQPRDAEILRMASEGLSSQEMAAATGMPVGSVRRTLSRARARNAERTAEVQRG